MTLSTSVVNVRMGELAAGGADSEFKTLLGSCIGIVLLDEQKQIGGLAHIVLPSSAGHTGPAGKFADTAIDELLNQLIQQGARRDHITARIAGGAAMFVTSAVESIGDKNEAAARRQLELVGIKIVGAHCGGTAGRKLTFKPSDGSVFIQFPGAGAVEI